MYVCRPTNIQLPYRAGLLTFKVCDIPTIVGVQPTAQLTNQSSRFGSLPPPPQQLAVAGAAA